MTESDWISSNSMMINQTWKFYDYAPLVF